MFLEAARFVSAKLVEPGIVEVEIEVAEFAGGDRSMDLDKGEKFTRKIAESNRHTFRASGLLDLSIAHITAETWIGNSGEDQPDYRFCLQFALHEDDGPLLLDMAMGRIRTGALTIQRLQLELPFGCENASIRWAADSLRNGTLKVTTPDPH